MQRNGISHAGKGQGKGFAKSIGGASDESEEGWCFIHGASL
jgi:hypothetical protein